MNITITITMIVLFLLILFCFKISTRILRFPTGFAPFFRIDYPPREIFTDTSLNRFFRDLSKAVKRPPASNNSWYVRVHMYWYTRYWYTITFSLSYRCWI